jgi:flagellar basal body-associated protein FliL
MKFCTGCGKKLVVDEEPAVAEEPAAVEEPVAAEEPAAVAEEAQVEVAPVKKSHTGIIVLISVVATLLVILGGIIAWLYCTDRLSDLTAMFGGSEAKEVSEEDEEIVGPDAYVDETAPLPTEPDKPAEEVSKDESDEEYTTIKKKDKKKKETKEEEPEIVEEEEPEPVPETEPDFILPNSDSELITYEVLEELGLSADECRIARNEIYARHGRRFSDESLQEYFDSKDWYEGTIDPSKWKESTLNKTERTNADTIAKYEKKKGYR